MTHRVRIILIAAAVFFLLTFASSAFAQSDKDWWKMSEDQRKDRPVQQAKPKNGPTKGQTALATTSGSNSAAEAAAKLTRADTFIRRDATVYVDEMDGFENYLMAAMRKKSVALIVVADPMQADYIIFGNSETKRAGWAKMFFLGSGRSGEMASITMVDRKTKVVVFADSSHRYNANRGKRSTAEKLAKYLGKKIQEDEKKMKN